LTFSFRCVIILRRTSARLRSSKRKAPLAESLFDVALKLFNLPRGASGEPTEAKMIVALTELILATNQGNVTNAMTLLAAINISIEVIRSVVETLVLVDVNLHFVTFLLSLGVITL
jgi:hypothetical protein